MKDDDYVDIATNLFLDIFVQLPSYMTRKRMLLLTKHLLWKLFHL